MDYDQFNAFCQSLPHSTHVVQWGNSHVWKIGGKLYAVGGWANDRPAFTFKAGDIGYEVLQDMPGLRPAPYLASRGMKWIQMYDEPGLSDEALKGEIEKSYHLVAAGLTKKKRRELGFET
jgi:predicted DNA-binding protein (MmcQ/YjbR family)